LTHPRIFHIPCSNQMSTGYLITKPHHKYIVHLLVLTLHSVGHLFYVKGKAVPLQA